MFNRDNITVFLAVLEHGSFSAAARKLGKAPSAVSMAIAGLEAELNLELFNRERREPRPTAAALALAPAAQEALHNIINLDAQALALHQGLEKELNIAIVPELLSARWDKPLAVLASEYPDLPVSIISVPQQDALTMLYQGELHLAIVFERAGMSRQERFIELGDEELIAVISPDHPVYDNGRRLLHQSTLLTTRQIAVASRSGAGADPRLSISSRIWKTDNYLSTLSLIQSGLGWGYLPRRLAEPQIRTGQLVKMEFDNMSNLLRLWVDVIWSSRHPPGLATRKLIDLIRAEHQS